MKVFNLYNDELGNSNEREGWNFRAAKVGEHIGGELLGAGLYEAEPGNKVWPYHTHHANEEWLLVVRGRPTLRTPEGVCELDEGAVVCFPRGKAGAHQVWNGSDSPIRVLMLSTLVTPEIVEYLDTGKVGAAKEQRVNDEQGRRDRRWSRGSHASFDLEGHREVTYWIGRDPGTGTPTTGGRTG